MRASGLFFRTFKEGPADVDVASHSLLEQAGYICRLGRGLFCSSSLMVHVLKKLCQIVREEMGRAGAIEEELPHLHPAALWQETGRWEAYLTEGLLYTLEDREGGAYCVAPTHEEAMTFFVRMWVKSYRDLPLNLYQIGAKFRDEIRPRFGLMRAKEFLMKDGYSFSATADGMDEQYGKMRKAYCAILNRLELDYVVVEVHGGKIGKGRSEEFQVKAQVGEDGVLLCDGYAVNVEAAQALPPAFDYGCATKKVRERVATPGVTTIEQLALFLNIPPQKILKTVVLRLIFEERSELVAIGIRGDRQVNALKVQDHFGAIEVAIASDEDVNQRSRAGFVGPIDSPFPFYADLSCRPMRDFCCACNEADVHLLHVNFEEGMNFHDFLLAEAGDERPGGGVYQMQRGIEVGHIFNLGTRYSDKMKALFQDEHGEQKPFWMGTYGIGIGRLAQACVEQKHDERGIVWPIELAPFRVVVIPAVTHDSVVMERAEALYRELADFDPLLDDRDQRLGFKLKDSDLIGIPYKVIVGKQGADDEVEIESRSGAKERIKRSALRSWAEGKFRDRMPNLSSL